MAAAPALTEMDELVEELLVRLPPDDPAFLVRAALVCKQWRRILAGRGFRRRYCELHRRPPMLGFLVFRHQEAGFCFTPTSSFRPRNADLRGRYAIDARHGLVLLSRSLCSPLSLQSNRNLDVWDPISGDWLELPELQAPKHLYTIGIHWKASMICGASNPSSACDGIDCHLGHFRVVLMAISQHRTYVYVYSSQAGTWSKPTRAIELPADIGRLCPIGLGALAGNALYFKVSSDLIDGILKYDLDTKEISSVNLPPGFLGECQTLLTTAEYGGLGIAELDGSRLRLWSGEAGPGGHLEWARSRVIELKTVLPANTHLIHMDAFLHGLYAFLVSTNNGVFNVDLESNRARKVREDSCGIAVPYMCFCTPALEASVGASSA